MIYLDNAATTPLLTHQQDELYEILNNFGNPSSFHTAGQTVKKVINFVKRDLLDMLWAKGGDIIFTSGGTESNNLAILGVADHLRSINRMTIITSCIEHPSVLNTCKHMESIGFNVIYMPVQEDGRIDIEELDNVMCNNRDTLGLVTIQTVNSEIGAIQNVADIGFLCEEYGALFHTDAVQAVGHIDINVDDWNIDMLSISGHKIYTPKGIGALYVRNKEILKPILYGGGQQYGLRPGTENTFGIALLGESVRRLGSGQYKERSLLANSSFMIRELEEYMKIPYSINCPDGCSHIISLTIPKVEGNSLMLMLSENGVCVSTGSACSSGSLEASYVLKAIGLSDKDAICTIRISLSHITSQTELSEAARLIGELSYKLYALN